LKKLLPVAALLLVLCILFTTGCSQEAKEEENGGEKQQTTIDDLHIKDSEAVYQNDDDDSVVTMYLTVSQGNEADNTNHTWEEVNAHSVFYYEELGIERYRVEGILQVGDENGPVSGMFGFGEFAPNCSVQIRGKTSTRSPQKSYKISIRKNEGYWREQRTIALNKHVYDSVRFRNKMSYDLLKTVPGAFSARTQFVHLYVKDLTEGNTKAKFEDYGLFTQVEQINKTYLRNHGLDENGHLYKANMFEFFRYEDAIKETSDPDYDQSKFEEVVEIKGSDDHSKLIAMLDDLNNYSIPIETTFEKYFDEENYFTWLAFQILTGNRDTTSQNFYLYSPLSGNKWYFIPWDNDDAWTYEEDVTYRGEPSGYHYTRGVSNYWGAVLHQRVLKSAAYRQKLDDKISELRNIVTKERITELVNTYSAVTRPFLARLPDQLHASRKLADYDKILKMIPNEMDDQYQAYKTSLESPMPFYVADPEPSQGKMMFSWDTAYDFNDERITYRFELASDYHFKNIVSKQDGLQVPQAFTKQLAAGQYFFKITAVNESGKTQTAMETYQGEDDKKYYGVASFYVKPDGTIQRN